jgi:hypothetical protein
LERGIPPVHGAETGAGGLLHAPVDLVDTDGEVSPLFIKVANHDRKLIYAASN